jgi:hypothetical protein
MRGIQVDVQRFRQLRRARGLTQPELAQGQVAGLADAFRYRRGGSRT